MLRPKFVCQLRVLQLDIRRQGVMDKIPLDETNAYFDVLFLSCPLLEKVDLKQDLFTNYVGDDIALRFDFTALQHLKDIKMDFVGISHYGLNGSGRGLATSWIIRKAAAGPAHIYIETLWSKERIVAI